MADASTGLAVDLRVRTLVLHQARGSASGAWRCHSATPRRRRGAGRRRAAPRRCGAGRRWPGLASGGVADGTRLEARSATGLAVGRRFVGTPQVGVGTSERGRDYRLGYRLGLLGGTDPAFDLGVEPCAGSAPAGAVA